MGAACKSECKDSTVNQSVEGPTEAVTEGEPLIVGRANVVAPGISKPDGRLILSWPSSPFSTRLLVPKLRFGLRGAEPARALGAVLCWCPPPGCSATPAPDQPGTRCMDLDGTIDIARYELLDTDLGQERDVDLLLDVTGTAEAASAALQLHVVTNDDIFTYECDRFEDPIF
jgi:hypothetical protein